MAERIRREGLLSTAEALPLVGRLSAALAVRVDGASPRLAWVRLSR